MNPPGLGQAVRAWARARPDALAVNEPGMELTYGELTRRAAGLQQALLACGVTQGERVALAAYGLADVAVCLVAVGDIGATAYPLDLTAALDVRLAHAAPAAVVLAGYPSGEWCAGYPVVHLDEVPSDGEPLEAASGVAVLVDEAASPVTRLLAADLLHRSCTAFAGRLALTADDRVMVLSLPHTDIAVFGVVTALLAGSTAVAPGRPLTEGERLHRLLERSATSVLVAAPRAVCVLTDVATAHGGRLPGLRAVVLLRDRWPARLPAALRRITSGDTTLLADTGAAEGGILAELREVAGDVDGDPPASPDAATTAEAVVESWPDVRMARLVDSDDGGPVVFVETVTGATVDAAGLTAQVGRATAGRIRPVRVVHLSALPLTDTGVVALDRLRARAAAVLPGAPPAGATAVRTADGLSAEGARVLARVAAGLGVADLSPDHSFFEVGATSLEIIRVVAQLEGELGVEFDIDELLDAPCVRTLVHQYEAFLGRSVPADRR
ncbi:non-ribosomal peptide synthetase [Micromonospora okii]|uniref:non-ribosomal peptide synthetase n=1 Tax=Micromonospora okii TaxID=1182970 RepID=UPI00272E6779|nr:AMP-binding protein [Micromonospora okii]